MSLLIEKKLSPHFSSRGGHQPELLILHADASPSASATIHWLQDPASKVSYHYLIGRMGHVYQLVEEEHKAWHAGKSTWPTHPGLTSLNAVSIGVSLSNDGSGVEQYTEAQYRVAGHLCAEIIKRHGILLHNIRGHSEVSPGRKTDPYEWFHWDEFYKWLGQWAGSRL